MPGEATRLIRLPARVARCLCGQRRVWRNCVKEGQRLLLPRGTPASLAQSHRSVLPNCPQCGAPPAAGLGQPGCVVGLTAPHAWEQPPRGYEAERLGRTELRSSAYFLHSAASHTTTAWTLGISPRSSEEQVAFTRSSRKFPTEPFYFDKCPFD